MAGESFKLRRLDNPTDVQLTASADIFAELEKDDVALRAMSGGDPDLLRPLGLAMIRAIALDGKIYAATNDADDVLGYVVTMPPGKVLFSTPEQKSLGYNQFKERLSEEAKDFYAAYLRKHPDFVSKSIAPLTRIDVWWLHIVMTRSQSQKQGIASGLIRMILKEASEAGATAVLSTTNPLNVPFYEGLGFLVADKMDASSPWGNWTMWIMKHEPKQ
ncbi:hypothetical protein EIP91_007372 [Steccherinum ochraceum]|uniref:N-acetyltransferase domain-containing protein n=1 Tax=Steccherinum ochraceum TaxID=92696 RepID=A0A4R0RXC8_9APHY|nr:hypothetical protein EIP91_007372 [Steccherinum ochraceum]